MSEQMGSRFDMHQRSIPCPICNVPHSHTARCNYDVLTTQIMHWKALVESHKMSIESLKKANVEAIDTAKAFQDILKDVEPNMSRMHSKAQTMAEVLRHALHLEHLGEGSTRGWARDALTEWDKEYGAKKLPAEPSKNDGEEVQRSEGH